MFDAHSDLFTEIARQRREEHKRDVFRSTYQKQYEKAGITGSIFVYWTDPRKDTDTRQQFLAMTEEVEQELLEAADQIYLAESFSDYQEGQRQGKISAIFGMEGLSPIGDDLGLLEEYYYRYHIRHASLTWNEENALAAGAGADRGKGLTLLGKQAVKKMQQLSMLLDVSHLNERSFWDMMRVAAGPVAATHSNAAALCPVRRNLSDAQLKELADTGGVVGVNAYHGFVHEKEEYKNIQGYVNHIEYIAEKTGIAHVGLGFDFNEYLEPGARTNISDLPDASCAGQVLAELERRGFSEEERALIAYKNFERLFKSVLK